jgi:hypothetical protein
MVPLTDKPASLSVTRAFVVQFRAATVIEQGYLTGRGAGFSRRHTGNADTGNAETQPKDGPLERRTLCRCTPIRHS